MGYGHHAVNGTRYCVYGNYMIVPAFGISGTEGINHDNSQDVDLLMHAAYDHCNSTSCVLMVNPMHHRTQNQLHLHFRHYNGGGAHLKFRSKSWHATTATTPLSGTISTSARTARLRRTAISQMCSARWSKPTAIIPSPTRESPSSRVHVETRT